MRLSVTGMFLVVCSLLACSLLWVLPAGAVQTRTWPFSTTGQYTVSDEEEIEVADGVAKLTLNDLRFFQTSLENYRTDSTTSESLHTGPFGAVRLAKDGELYELSGQFTSRVFEKPEGVVWKRLAANASNVLFDRSRAEIPTNHAGLVCLYHLDGNLEDAVGDVGPLTASGDFYPVGRIGSKALYSYRGFKAYVPNASLLAGNAGMTMAFWVKSREWNDNKPVVSSPGNHWFGLVQGLWGGRQMMYVRYQNTYLGSKGRMDMLRWYWIVIVYSGSKVQLYVDAEMQSESAANYGPVAQTAPIQVGDFSGDVDELAIWNRALSVDEVVNLYLQLRAVKFGVRSGDALPLTGEFVGPDGTFGSRYTGVGDSFVPSTSFVVSDPYIQYRAYLDSDALGEQTPVLDSVTIMTSDGSGPVDDTLGDYEKGTFNSATNEPAKLDWSGLGLSKDPNGGYRSDGTYLSRPVDAGEPVTWTHLAWELTQLQIDSATEGLLGLWHMDGNWSDVSPYDRQASASPTVAFTELAKVGLRSCVFDDDTATVTLEDVGEVKSLVFWVKPNEPNGALVEFDRGASGDSAYVSLTNGWLQTSGFDGQVIVYVNASTVSPKVANGWNHVALTFADGFSVSNLVVGAVGSDPLVATMDEMAAFDRVLTPGEVAAYSEHAPRYMAGNVALKIRSAATIGQLLSTPFSTAYTDPKGADLFGYSGQYFQYQVIMSGDGTATPGLSSVVMKYDVINEIVDDTSDVFGQGDFDEDSTRWYGNDMTFADMARLGPFGTSVGSDTSWQGLWQMEEEAWEAGQTVLDSSGRGRHGTPSGEAAPVAEGRVGLGAGSFNGTDAYVTLQSITDMLANDFTVALWFKTSSTNRAALISNYDGQRYFTLEINGDGSGAPAPGVAAFIVNDLATGARWATSLRDGLNDNAWHHLSGLRRGDFIHIYVDGERVGTTEIGPAYAYLGIGAPLLGKYGTEEIYYEGMLDEVGILLRAMSEAEIGQLAGVGVRISEEGQYEGPVIDAGRISIWRQISWGADGPHGISLEGIDPAMVGLWHVDETSGTVQDSSGNGNSGTVDGGEYGADGVFSNSIRFVSSGDGITVAHSGMLEPESVTVEAWIWPDLTDGGIIASKHDGATGYRLGLDAVGHPFFEVGTAKCTDWLSVLDSRWNHVAGTYDGNVLRLFVNGELRATTESIGEVLASGVVLGLGQSSTGADTFRGKLDEIVMYNRALNGEEVLDHYRSAYGDIEFQVRGGDSLPLTDPFVGPDGTENTYFKRFAGSSTDTVIGRRQYFQYRARIKARDNRYEPTIRGVRVDVTSFSSTDPWVEPADGYGFNFVGRLTGLSHVLGDTGAGTDVQYQISGDNGGSWYYWNDTSQKWEIPSGLGYPFDMTDVTTLDSEIDSFFDQLYPTSGGTFKFRAFLHSLGDYQIELDEVQLTAASGRLVVTAPNGGEVGQDAWVIGTTNNITWDKAGTTGPNVKIEFSDNGGSSYTTVIGSTPNDGSYAWLTPGDEFADQRNQCRIRITDLSDPNNIWDISDDNFELVYRYRLVAPNGGETWYIGETNVVRWQSPPGLGDQADLWYNLDGFASLNGTGWRKFATVPNINAGSTNNTYAWVTPTDDPDLISAAARIRVTIQGAVNFHDMSDASYTMAGIRITNPNSSTAWKRGSAQTVTWQAAGSVTNGVTLEYSGDAGATWTNVQSVVPSGVGSNSYTWTIVADNPSENAQLRMVSRTEPRITALSDVFTVADIDIKAPVADEEWQTLQTNDIVWTAGGAGDKVNIYYSVDYGSTWVGIDLNVDNVNAPATNTFPWLVPDLPGDALIKIESALSPELFAISEQFKIAGIRVTSPNGGARWELGENNKVEWVDAASGGGGLVRFSYDGGHSYVNLAGPGFPLLAREYAYTPITPTVRAMARVEATDSAYAALGVAGESDGYFTVAGLKVTEPLQDEVIKMGVETAEAMKWLSAGLLDDSVDVIYSDGTTETTLFNGTFNDESFSEVSFVSGANLRDWTPARTLNPSGNARIKVVGGLPQVMGVYTGLSARFTLQGVRVTQPTTGSQYNIGATRSINWLNAGFTSAARAQFYLSTDGGSTYEATPLFGTDTALNLQTKSWPIPLGTRPTTNAVVKLQVTNDPTSFEAWSQPFTLKGIKVEMPSTGTSWDLGATETVQLQVAAIGNSVSLYYSPDGVTYDYANPIGEGLPVSDGLNDLSWTIETFRTPSTNAHIRAESVATDDAVNSDPFTLAGILVTEPSSVNIWAANETNHIEWIAVGTSGNFQIDLVQADGTTVIQNVTPGVSGTSFDWPTPMAVVGTDLRIRVTELGGSGYVAISELFKIVGSPTLEVLQPTDGAFLKNQLTYQVVWTKAGDMPLNFQASYSFDNFASSNIISGTPVFSNNQYFLSWTLSDPGELGKAKVRVVNTSVPSIQDTTADINLVANLRVTAPNGGETFYALKPTVVSWFTLGNMTDVDLYYSVDPLRAPGSWVKINTGGPIVGRGHNNSSQYFWEVTDYPSGTVWIRVQDANYTQMFPVTTAGPYDDCDATFSILYYQINWRVTNRDTGADLDKLTVSDSSGWSESGLQSPIIHYYPYGYYDTVWSRALFKSKVEFNWLADDNKTIDVELEETDEEPDFDVMANFAYDSANRSFNIQSWIERGGQVLGNATASTIEIYESDGDKIKTISNGTPLNGVFWNLWDVNATEDSLYGTNFNYSASEVFWAKVMVQFSGEWYSSALTFQLRQPASDEILQVIDAIEASASNILGEVSGIGTLIGGVSNQIGDLSTDMGDGFADVLSSIGTNRQILLDDVLPGIGDISNNLVNVFGPSITNTEALVQLMYPEVGGARILTRPLELIRGSTNTFLYRTQNYDPSVVDLYVRDTADNQISQYNMVRYGSVAGIYRADVVIPSTFTYDTAVIQCVDPDATDRLVVEILDPAEGNLAGVMTEVYNAVTNMSSQISGLDTINTQLGGLTTVLEGMTNDMQRLSDAVNNLPDLSVVTQEINELSVKLDNLPDLGDLTNIIGNLETKIDNLPDLSIVTQKIDELGVKVDSLPDLSGLSNMFNDISMKIDSLPDLSGMSNSIALLQSAIAQIPTNIDFTAVQDGIDNLRTDLAGLLGVDLTGAQSSLDSILSQVESIGGVDLSGMDSIQSEVTSLGTQLQSLQSALQGVNEVNLSDLDSRLATLQGAIEGVNRIEDQIGSTTGGGGGGGTLFDQLNKIETATESAGSSAADAEQYASNAKTKAGDAASGVQALKQALASGDSEEAQRQLKIIRESLAAAKADLAKIPEGVTLNELQDELKTTKQTLSALARSNGFTWLTSMGEDAIAGRPAAEGEEPDLGKLSSSVEELRGSMEFMQKLLDKEVNKPVVEEQWLSVEE